MKFFGKFEKDSNNRIYRTKTFICLDGSSSMKEPKISSIIGTIFMLNPGSSRPLGSDINTPFNNSAFFI